MTLARAVTLSTYGLKRIFRSRALVAALAALPAACGIAGLLWKAVPFAWIGPLLCAALVAAILAVQRSVDDATSLSAALRSSPVGAQGLTVSRIVLALALFVPQVLILTVIIRCGG